MSLEEFIAENSWVEYHSGEKTFVMEVDALREFVKGKVLVDRDSLDFWRNDLALHGVGDIETAKELDAISEQQKTTRQPNEIKA